MNSLFLSRPYLSRADGFLTLDARCGRRGGSEFGLLAIGAMMLMVAAIGAAGISAFVV